MNIDYLTVRDVTIIHFMVMKKYGAGEHAGIREQGLLESAVHRPQQSAFGEDAYPLFNEKAGALFESLARNHCFFNGNKRTAFASLDIFLKKNGVYIMQNTDENEEFTVAVAEGKVSLSDSVIWLKSHTKKR
ncbi:type II toxin-antitoxin system death-on-curing family toxin [Virgibacillus flavescens]|uniref:type II toxin-antitoxin system death-on-curing family toxin n=1 Tax=Virgibacillus flavescens TaxID=1611422 RepID=UPI003D347225